MVYGCSMIFIDMESLILDRFANWSLILSGHPSAHDVKIFKKDPLRNREHQANIAKAVFYIAKWLIA